MIALGTEKYYYPIQASASDRAEERTEKMKSHSWGLNTELVSFFAQFQSVLASKGI